MEVCQTMIAAAEQFARLHPDQEALCQEAIIHHQQEFQILLPQMRTEYEGYVRHVLSITSDRWLKQSGRRCRSCFDATSTN